MKYISVLFSILLTLSLVSCSLNDKPEVKPPPDPPLTLTQDIGKPPPLGISRIPDISDASKPTESGLIFAAIGKYCWEEAEKSCTIKHEEPFERLLQHPSTTFHKGEKIGLILYVTSLDYPKALAEMDKINVDFLQYYKDEESKIDIDEVDADLHTFYIHAPEQPGRYYYSAVLRWEGDLKGQANYAFSFSVK